MLQIDNLHAEVDGKPIPKGLTFNAGETDVIGSGADKPPLGEVERRP